MFPVLAVLSAAINIFMTFSHFEIHLRAKGERPSAHASISDLHSEIIPFDLRLVAETVLLSLEKTHRFGLIHTLHACACVCVCVQHLSMCLQIQANLYM